MQITKEETGALTASVKLLISKEDYEEKVLKTLKDYQRKANMPGFRPGKVPFGMVSKMYRKGVLLDEINHLIAENLQKYIEESNLKLIGSPVANKEKASALDLDLQSDFEFYFDIGLAPEFELDLSENFAVDYLKITATENMIDDQVNELRQRSVNHTHKDVHSEEGHSEVEHSEEEHSEEGHLHEEEHSHEEHSHEEDHSHEKEHSHEELPELNEAFFNQVFPGQEIKDEMAFREKIREALEQSLVKESERFFLNSVIEKLVKETGLELPDEFIRKMIRENDEHNLSEEQIESQYINYANSIRWQLIESRIITENNLRVEESEMRNVVKSYFTGHLTNTEEDPQHDERLNKIVDSVLSNKEEVNRLHDQLFDRKLLDFFKGRLKLNDRQVDYNEFVKMVTEKKA